MGTRLGGAARLASGAFCRPGRQVLLRIAPRVTGELNERVRRRVQVSHLYDSCLLLDFWASGFPAVRAQHLGITLCRHTHGPLQRAVCLGGLVAPGGVIPSSEVKFHRHLSVCNCASLPRVSKAAWLARYSFGLAFCFLSGS
jgi:myo-inositol catabolism protein IolC